MSKPPLPLQFQHTGIWRIEDRHEGRCIVADDMGLGKSMQSLHGSKSYRRKRPAIIICPAPVKYGWRDEIKKHRNEDCMVLEGRKVPRSTPKRLPPYIVVNWEILNDWLPWLLQIGACVVIIDELHYGKNSDTHRGKAMLKLCADVPCIVPLSGTPIENGPIEFYPILHLLWPKEFPSKRAFGMRYCNPTFTKWGIQYKGASHMKELNRRLRKLGWVRRLRTDVLDELPPIQRVLVDAKMEHPKEYNQAANHFVRWLHKHKPGKIHKLKDRTFAMQRLNYLLQIVAEQKLKWEFKWIDNFLETSNEKLCIYGHHRKILEAVHEKYASNSVLWYGGQSKKKRAEIKHRFVNDPKCRLFIGSILAAGTGIDGLQLICSKLLLIQLYWVGVKLLQLEGRLWRLGQKDPVTAYYALAKNTVETKLAKTIWEKQEILKKILDGDFSSKQEFDILKEVFKDLAK